MMERLYNALKKNTGISDWRLVHCRSTGYQMYAIRNMLDSIRKVVTDKYHLTIYCDREDRRGSTHLTLFNSDFDNLESKLEKAVLIAGRMLNPKFSLPSPVPYPFVESFDPTLLGDVEDILFVQLGERLLAAVDREPNVSLSSSEYFLELLDIHLVNSRGIDLDYKKSEIFFDGVLLAGSGEEELEIHFEPRARRLQDLPVESTIARYARFARDSLQAVLPASGTYPVVLSGNALSAVFSPLIHHTSGVNQYRRTSALTPGESICPNQKCLGEPLTMISNGFTPFGLKTAPCDVDGLPAIRFELIREGLFQRAWTTSQYGDYLGIPPTGSIGNIEIPIGRQSRLDLLKQSGPVLEVVEFSALMPDVVSGNFAAEIKLGYEYLNGKVTPVRGGSISGNFIGGFQHAFYSTESQVGNYALSMDNFGTYTGPEAIRFETFQVSGR